MTKIKEPSIKNTSEIISLKSCQQATACVRLSLSSGSSIERWVTLHEHSFLSFYARLNKLKNEQGAYEQLQPLSRQRIPKVRMEFAWFGHRRLWTNNWGSEHDLLISQIHDNVVSNFSFWYGCQFELSSYLSQQRDGKLEKSESALAKRMLNQSQATHNSSKVWCKKYKIRTDGFVKFVGWEPPVTDYKLTFFFKFCGHDT